MIFFDQLGRTICRVITSNQSAVRRNERNEVIEWFFGYNPQQSAQLRLLEFHHNQEMHGQGVMSLQKIGYSVSHNTEASGGLSEFRTSTRVQTRKLAVKNGRIKCREYKLTNFLVGVWHQTPLMICLHWVTVFPPCLKSCTIPCLCNTATSSLQLTE